MKKLLIIPLAIFCLIYSVSSFADGGTGWSQKGQVVEVKLTRTVA